MLRALEQWRDDIVVYNEYGLGPLEMDSLLEHEQTQAVFELLEPIASRCDSGIAVCIAAGVESEPVAMAGSKAAAGKLDLDSTVAAIAALKTARVKLGVITTQEACLLIEKDRSTLKRWTDRDGIESAGKGLWWKADIQGLTVPKEK